MGSLSAVQFLEKHPALASNFITALQDEGNFDAIGFSHLEWMQHYLEIWMEEIPFSNGRNLIQEWQNLQAKLQPPSPEEIDVIRQQSEKFGQAFTQKDEDEIMASARRRRAKILGPISVEELPDDIFEHQVRRSIGMSFHDWKSLDPHTKGYEMALYSVNNMMEGIKTYHQQEEMRARQEKANQERGKKNKSKSGSRSRPRPSRPPRRRR